ncbi:MAG: hypothetical protein Q9209_004035 [Squamulea sp. 1 TL-2023]
MSLVDATSAYEATKKLPSHPKEVPRESGLLDLPNEILAEILSYLLKAPALMVNAAVPKIFGGSFCDFDHPAGAMGVDIRVLVSCKFLNHIGNSILYEQSTFIYNMRSDSVWIGARRRPQLPITCKPPTRAQHLIVRLQPNGKGLTSDQITLEANEWLCNFWGLQTLQMDFCFLETAYQSPRKVNFRNEKERRMFLDWTEQRFSESLTSVSEKRPRLQKLVLSGLPCNEMSISLIKAWARFVVPEGLIGVGYTVLTGQSGVISPLIMSLSKIRPVAISPTGTKETLMGGLCGRMVATLCKSQISRNHSEDTATDGVDTYTRGPQRALATQGCNELGSAIHELLCPISKLVLQGSTSAGPIVLDLSADDSGRPLKQS